MHQQAAITGWGSYSPERILTNQDLGKLVETTDSWIQSRTGIRQRHLAGPDETTSSMCVTAAQLALRQADLSARDLDLVICASTTPDFLLPASACLVQQRIGADRAGAFDLNCACSSFIYALSVASQFIKAGSMRRVLVVAGETLSRVTDYTDRNTCILFGDGAAAVILEATTQNAGILSSVLGSRGDVELMLTIPAGGSAKPATVATAAAGEHFIRMRGNEVFKQAVRHMSQAALEALSKAGLRMDDLRAIIPHQANSRIIHAIQEVLRVPREKVFLNVADLGNTGSASVPIAMGALFATQPADPGDNYLTVAFGGGLTWGAVALRWADIAAIRRERSLRSSAAAA